MSVWANIIDTNSIDRSYRKKYRLTTPNEFRHLFQHAHRRTSNYFTLLYCRNKCGYPRLGLTISRKCARSAVVRNRIKRLVRESFRLNKDEANGFDVVFIGRAGISLKSNSDLSREINGHFSFLTDHKK